MLLKYSLHGSPLVLSFWCPSKIKNGHHHHRTYCTLWKIYTLRNCPTYFNQIMHKWYYGIYVKLYQTCSNFDADLKSEITANMQHGTLWKICVHTCTEIFSESILKIELQKCSLNVLLLFSGFYAYRRSKMATTTEFS